MIKKMIQRAKIQVKVKINNLFLKQAVKNLAACFLLDFFYFTTLNI